MFGDKSLRSLTFQSTPPVKAATSTEIVLSPAVKFQSTPPVKAATSCIVRISYYCMYFNPRRP